MSILDQIRRRHALKRFASRHGIQPGTSPQARDAGVGQTSGDLLTAVQTYAGLDPTGTFDGPTVELLLPDTPFGERVVRIARAELGYTRPSAGYRWAGSSPQPACETSRNWPFRWAGTAVRAGEAGRHWPTDSQWKTLAAEVAAACGSDPESLSVAFCRFVYGLAGFAGPWPAAPATAAGWIDYARRGASENFAAVEWNDATRGDAVVFHWGAEGPADHLGISLRYRRYFHDVVTLARQPAVALPEGATPGHEIIAIPLYTHDIEQVIRLLP